MGKIKLRIEPQKNRVAITEQKGNSTHWAEIRQQNPEEDINKVRKGRNGKEWDMLVIHQCLHDLWRQDWNGAKRFDCAGLVEFSVAANVCKPLSTATDNAKENAEWLYFLGRLYHKYLGDNIMEYNA